MAGYKGFSMSNNAVAAYESGEKPISKWTKREILSMIKSLSKIVILQLVVPTSKPAYIILFINIH